MTGTRTSPPLGAKVYVEHRPRPYTVRARDDRYAVCTKPHFKTVMYFICDAVEGVRGTENLVFGFGAETDEECQEMLARVAAGETEISHRNRVPWDLERVIEPAFAPMDDYKRVRGERDAALREADRLRHNIPIESDFVCPNEPALHSDSNRNKRAIAWGERRLGDCLRTERESKNAQSRDWVYGESVAIRTMLLILRGEYTPTDT